MNVYKNGFKSICNHDKTLNKFLLYYEICSLNDGIVNDERCRNCDGFVVIMINATDYNGTQFDLRTLILLCLASFNV